MRWNAALAMLGIPAEYRQTLRYICISGGFVILMVLLFLSLTGTIGRALGWV